MSNDFGVFIVSVAPTNSMCFSASLGSTCKADTPTSSCQVEVARQKIRQLMHEQERAADYEDRLARLDGTVVHGPMFLLHVRRTVLHVPGVLSGCGSSAGSSRSWMRIWPRRGKKWKVYKGEMDKSQS